MMRARGPDGGLTEVAERDHRQQTRETRRERLQVLRDRYARGDKVEKGKVLDELVAQTGYHRKHAARLLRRRADEVGRQRFYDAAARDLLVAAWEASGRAGTRRLKTLLPELVAHMARQRRVPAALRAKLFAMSAATADRLLRPARAAALAEQRLVRFAEAIRSFSALAVQDDVPAEERQRVQEHRQRLLEAMRCLVGADGDR